MAEANSSPQSSIDSRIKEARRALKRNWALTVLTGKKPKLSRWQRLPPATLSQVIKWITNHNNLGLRTGQVSGVVVIDDDSVDGSASAGLNLPKTVTVITGTKKKHFYFRAPNFKVTNSVKSLAPNVDVRGDGGQVVYVGSTHPDTGLPYTWAPGLSPEEVEIAELPANVIELLKAPGTKSAKTSTLKLVEAVAANDSAEQQSNSRVDAYAEAAMDAELDSLHASTEGNRNDTLNKSAFALGQLVGAGALDRHRVHAALHAAAIGVGLSETESDATIRSGLDAGAREPRDLSTIVHNAPTSDGSSTTPEGDDDSRPTITLYAGWLHSAVTKAERILLRQTPPLLYQRGPSLVRILVLPEAGAGRSICQKPMIYEVTSAALVDKLTELVRWQKKDKSGDLFAIDCPERVALTLLSRSGSWRLPPLIGVIDSPTLRCDGGILSKEGYDRASGLFLALGGRTWPAVPGWPTIDDARAALDKLQWVLKDFPFVERADLSVALAAILTPLIRPSIRTAPLFAFRAAKMGSGKSLLADIVSLIATGRPAAVMSQGADENEDKKRMLPILAEGDPVAVIDNIERPFGSAALCSILTQPVWRDRVLGKSQTLSLPTTNTTWLATGNNIVFAGDITTRVVICDLDPKCEHPEERKFQVNLHHYVPAHREELVVAGLTILRAYHIANRPDQSLPVFGRFEEWSDWPRSALVWLGLADPCETRRRAEETDPVRAELANLVAALRVRFGTRPFRVADVLAAQDDDAAIRDAVAPILAASTPGQSHAQCLGLFFARIHRRPEGGARLVRHSTRSGSGTWGVEDV